MCYLQKNKIKFRNEKSSSHEDGKNQKNDGKQEAKAQAMKTEKIKKMMESKKQKTGAK